ncbi:ATP-dependent Clp protease, adaptor protein ClpS [Syntrophotalea carbinolica DSM 2380]|uniref:ATP-dependent Clp protease adapter protein ClpS n=1 Tax=Syntrophotalea carbinolica (strain DSM 2380 / NBRC 103641 / GraBd1) TaxID=338963 RepID=Q3A2A7_SYNC1|nr:ATP-dependent Clp protease adapter ClpS [Syntrophotalea carbinolica]ABA89500.1 ATP-dependent Clp protease, adaptor protein ClpS [Syntrophotalea carbinolica DSM 2380]
MSQKKTSSDVHIEERKATRTAPPPLFRVLMHNDDYTTMEFVVEVLQGVFHKSAAEAHRIMLNIHNEGTGQCGTFPHEIAETKVARVHQVARQAGFPLRCSLEEA